MHIDSIFDRQRYFHVAQNLFDASHQVFKVFREEVAYVSDAERVSNLPGVNDLIFVAELLVEHLEVEVGVRWAEVGRDDVWMVWMLEKQGLFNI